MSYGERSKGSRDIEFCKNKYSQTNYYEFDDDGMGVVNYAYKDDNDNCISFNDDIDSYSVEGDKLTLNMYTTNNQFFRIVSLKNDEMELEQVKDFDNDGKSDKILIKFYKDYSVN
ncbi:lipocalin-like domain-containing protein [Riemerella columbipharyngis]|uniref:Lipocalin-like domain-containing protein n=1 Tax=Riemerella columbipharyngis TaxID=1071918 RepID=A0A1G6YT88_9FLAO|nr:lipocalin family protein [Riemerella columbipharyngis]SDD93273.1 Lipocalin-like domain-containing protein [Riemerella columbipharyngis]